jgi:hypothetical protein
MVLASIYFVGDARYAVVAESVECFLPLLPIRGILPLETVTVLAQLAIQPSKVRHWQRCVHFQG